MNMYAIKKIHFKQTVNRSIWRTSIQTKSNIMIIVNIKLKTNLIIMWNKSYLLLYNAWKFVNLKRFLMKYVKQKLKIFFKCIHFLIVITQINGSMATTVSKLSKLDGRSYRMWMIISVFDWLYAHMPSRVCINKKIQ